MKGLVKALIIGAVIIGLGIAVFLIGLGLNGWKLPNRNVTFEMQSFTESGKFTSVDIDLNAGKVKTEFYDGDKITVDYAVADGFTSEISEEGETLKIKTPRKKWFYWGIFSVEIPETVIKIPAGRTVNLTVDMDAGTVVLADGNYGEVNIDMDAGAITSGTLNCSGDFKCEVAAGAVNFGAVKCNGFDTKISAGAVNFGAVECDGFTTKLSAGAFDVNSLTAQTSQVKISAGSVTLNYTGARAEYSVSSSVSAGSCNVSAQSGTTDKSIDVKVSAGKATFNFNG